MTAPLRLLALTVLVAAPPRAESDDLFAREVQPLLARRCAACHGPETAEGGLNLTVADALTAETDSGETAIVLGEPDASELIRRITSHEEYEQMPPEGARLTAGEVDLLRRWIEGGAEYEEHWAFVPPTDPSPPDAGPFAGRVRNGVDRFVFARLAEAGLEPNPEADRRTLVVRLYQDLIGLPPTLAEIEAFAADESPGAYERLADELLASPHYGERWGRHWLDVVRYAESNSFERDNPKPNAWRYRDWVIDSLNADKPYDRFVLEQLAGDELDDVTPETLTATGYLRLGLWDDEPADPELAKFEGYDDLVSTTGQAMLGLTVGCARCHDHKIDPIPQRDYYEMVAFFRGMTDYATRGDQMDSPLSQVDVTDDGLKRRYAELEQAEREVRDQMRPIEQRGIAEMPAPAQRATEGRRREKVLREKLRDHLSEEDWQEYTALKTHLEAVRQKRSQLPPRTKVLAVTERTEVPETFVMERGNAHVPGERVVPAFIDLLGGGEAVVEPTGTTSGRRRALAEWIASPGNGLTSRVIANRLWQHHFGRGIVRSSNNFGQLGTPPTHPLLLDWLAARVVKNGWRLKAVHKLIVTSSAYRMSTDWNAEAAAKDPANDLLWRRDVRRMDAEEVRDAVLLAAGNLDLTVGGPSVYPRLPQEVLAGQSKPGDNWDLKGGDRANRRSVYIHVKRSLAVPLLKAFDAPDPDSSCEARFKTVQPAQALTLLNSEFLNEQAAVLAKSVAEAPDPVAGVYERVLRRPVTDAERADAARFLDSLAADHGLEGVDALKLLALVAFNGSEFLYVR